MFGFVSKKIYDSVCKNLVRVTNKNDELDKENNNLKHKLEVIIEDNQELRSINDFYIEKYKNAKNIIRILNNENPNNIQIPENCPKCNTLLVYNEYAHIATCPNVDCDTIIK